MRKIIRSIFIVVAAVFIALPSPAQTATDSVKKIDIKVANLHCNNDMPTIKKRLLNQDGIDEVKFTDIANDCSVFTITYHTSVTDQPQIEKTIESTPGCDDKHETPYRVKRKKVRS